MMRRLSCLGSVVLPLVLVASEPAASPKHLVEAVSLLKNLSPENTSYRHKDTVVKWAGNDGECHTDCSGFLNSLLLHSYPQHDAESLKRWLGKARPTADCYFETIQAKRGFTQITQIADVQPGDFIAVKYPPNSADTGHAMLVAEKPKKRKATAPLVPDTEQWEVMVIDSSRSGHGKTDTRHKDDGAFRSGLGKGMLRLYTKSGAVIGYSWSVLSASEFRDDMTKALVIGRLDPKFRPDDKMK